MQRVALFLLLSGTLFADVLVLKGGGKVGGRVVDKGTHYEITAEGVLRTYLKEEVDKVLTGPKELLEDADASYEAAKKDFEAALALGPADQQARFKEAVAKVTRARELYAAALDVFPEDDALGRKLVLIMQLMRLCRERLGSEVARAPAAGSPVVNAPSGGIRADDAHSVLHDAAKRVDPAKRAAAVASLRSQRAASPDAYDLATAAIQFLSQDLKLEGPAAKAVQDYFDKGWLKDPQKLTPAAHQEAAAWLGALLPSVRNTPAGAVLEPFALVHLTHAPAGPEVEKTAKALSFLVQNGRIGTAEGHAAHDLAAWIRNGDFDLAVLAFVREYRSQDTPAVRYVWSYALLRLVQQKKRGFERPVGAYGSVRAAGPAAEHVAAMLKSIQAAAVCSTCAGEGRNRCTNCHGKKEIKYTCAKCRGKGSTTSSLGAAVLCLPCKGSGFDRILKCEKCADGYFDCKQCEKAKTPPEMEEICEASACEACEGRGSAFRRALVPCRACLGLGLRLTPKADPAKVLRP
jgi:hypothetical protein